MYLSKDTCLKLYQILGALHEIKRDPEEQGSVQCTSALRYFLATDEFVNQHKHSCDSKDGVQKDLFRKYVAHVVDLDGMSYTANFRKTINLHESDLCAVGSNFFSVNVVKDSLVDPKTIFSFPRRKKGNELLKIVNGTIAIHASGYDSFAHLFVGKSECAFSLCLWLVRDDSINEAKDISEAVLDVLRKRYSKKIIDILCPSKNAFRNFILSLKQPLLTLEKEVITREDFVSEVKPKPSEESIVFNVRDQFAYLLRIFREVRSEEEWQTCKDGYKGLNIGMRDYFEEVTADEILDFELEAFKEFFKKQTWMGRNGSGFAAISQAIESAGGSCEKHKKFIAALMTNPKFPSEYWVGERPGGIGHALISELLMKFHPFDYAMYNRRTHDALTFLGLIDGTFSSDFTADQYTRVTGIQAMIRQKMREMKIQSLIEDDSPDADFLTVNEFLFWVENNKELIKEQMMAEKIKPVETMPAFGTNELDRNDKLMVRLMAALRTKPFAILAGHSGTGKSRMVRRLAYMTCCDKGLWKKDSPENLCMIQVKPNWHDSTELLGYYSALEKRYKPSDFVKFIVKAYAYPNVPFFVCLDEMNLAPVEQYFAEYLSAIEGAKFNEANDFITDSLVSEDVSIADFECVYQESVDWINNYGLTIPKNLFVVGTVNMDDTTCQFSRKVLDRAMTVEMNEIEFKEFGSVPATLDKGLLLKQEVIQELLAREVSFNASADDETRKAIVAKLEGLKAALQGTAFQIAYRFANEFALYVRSLKAFGAGDLETAFDHIVLMKVLPRIAGEKAEVLKVFEEVEKLMAREDSLTKKKIAEIKGRDEPYPQFWP